MPKQGQIDFTIKCDNCKGEMTCVDVENDLGTIIWVDCFSCNCYHYDTDVDCGFDDRGGKHSHIWMAASDVAAYCKELQEEISKLKRLVLENGGVIC